MKNKGTHDYIWYLAIEVTKEKITIEEAYFAVNERYFANPNQLYYYQKLRKTIKRINET